MVRKKKFDGVIEAVRYAPNGQIDQVRAYERSGFVFSDWLVLDRDALIERLKDGKRWYIGQRKIYLGNDFEISEEVRLEGPAGTEKVIAGEADGKQDYLQATPAF
jgi:hypothetical protein